MQSANHTFILVISTPTVPYNTPLAWYVFTVYSQLASVYSHWRKHLALQECSYQAVISWSKEYFRDKCALYSCDSLITVMPCQLGKLLMLPASQRSVSFLRSRCIYTMKQARAHNGVVHASVMSYLKC